MFLFIILIHSCFYVLLTAIQMAKITLAVVHLALSLSLVTALLVFAQTTLVGAAKSRCESSRVSFHAAVDSYAIYKHVIRSVKVSTAQECYERCIDDCSCQTFQLYQNKTVKCCMKINTAHRKTLNLDRDTNITS